MGSIKNNNFEEFMDGITDDGNSVLKQECERLLNTSAFDDDEKARIEKDLWYFHEEELNALRANLLMNQVDRINAGMGYNQTDIRKKLLTEI